MPKSEGDYIGLVAGEQIVIPPLDYPDPPDEDDALAHRIQGQLETWAVERGLYSVSPESIRDQQIGRLAMLAYPAYPDEEQLLLGAKTIATLFELDDRWCDERSKGADPMRLGARLGRASELLEDPYVSNLLGVSIRDDVRADRVLTTLDWLLGDIEAIAAKRYQLDRFCDELELLFVSLNAETSWRLSGYMPTEREYFKHRQSSSFLPYAALIDVISGYALPPGSYKLRPLRRATQLAAASVAIVNDLFSLPKEVDAALVDYSLPTVIRHWRGNTLQDAVIKSAEIHNEVIGEQAALTERIRDQGVAAEVQHFLFGLQNAMKGNYAWHRSTGRYQT